jgi:hypothetical protein
MTDRFACTTASFSAARILMGVGQKRGCIRKPIVLTIDVHYVSLVNEIGEMGRK